MTIGGVAFLLSVALSAVATRIWRSAPPFMAFLGVSMIVSIALLAWLFWFIDGDALDIAAGLLVYLAGVEFYVLYILLVAYSVSASVLANTFVQALSPAALAELYSDEKMLAMRLGRLRSLRLISEDHGILTITRAGYRLFRTLDRVRGFFAHDLDSC